MLPLEEPFQLLLSPNILTGGVCGENSGGILLRRWSVDECNPCPSVCHYTSRVCLCAVPQLWKAKCLAVERVCILGAFGAYPAILGKVRDPSLDTPYSWVAGHKLSLPHWWWSTDILTVPLRTAVTLACRVLCYRPQ